jgi:tRNA(Ile)-lysidine synthase
VSKQAADISIDPDTLRAAVAHLIGEDAAADGRLGIAVSGGPDSMALLSLAAIAFPGRVSAATVDHGLRPESAEEARMVADYCSAHSIAHSIRAPAAPINGSLQASARAARYALLGEWRIANGIDWILTAHHADDQLETVVMRLNRASGVRGLAAIRARQGHVLRPLLGVRRCDLLEWVTRHHIPFVQDPSNENPAYDRARLRAAMAGQDWLHPIAAAQSAQLLADADDALEWMTQSLASTRLCQADDASWVLDVSGVPDELRWRLLHRALECIAPLREPLRRKSADHALNELSAGRAAMIGDILLKPGRGDPLGAIRLMPAPPRRNA